VRPNAPTQKGVSKASRRDSFQGVYMVQQGLDGLETQIFSETIVWTATLQCCEK